MTNRRCEDTNATAQLGIGGHIGKHLRPLGDSQDLNPSQGQAGPDGSVPKLVVPGAVVPADVIAAR